MVLRTIYDIEQLTLVNKVTIRRHSGLPERTHVGGTYRARGGERAEARGGGGARGQRAAARVEDGEVEVVVVVGHHELAARLVQTHADRVVRHTCTRVNREQ